MFFKFYFLSLINENPLKRQLSVACKRVKSQEFQKNSFSLPLCSWGGESPLAGEGLWEGV